MKVNVVKTVHMLKVKVNDTCAEFLKLIQNVPLLEENSL